MNDEARSIFLCPTCGGPSVVTDEGDAACMDCSHRFPIPSQVQKKNAPQPVRIAKKNTGGVQRNISLPTKFNSASVRQIEPKMAPVPSNSKNLHLPQENEEPRRRRSRSSESSESSRSKPKRYLVWGIVWLCTVVAVFFVVFFVQNGLLGRPEGDSQVSRLVGEEKKFYEREYPRIRERFQDFLAVKTVDQMPDFAFDSGQLHRKIARFFQESTLRYPRTRLDSEPVFWNVAFEENPGFVEVVWDVPDSPSLECVFVKTKDNWLLDWEHFVRYSSVNWTFFSQRVGTQKKGAFRVYVEAIKTGQEEDLKPWVEVELLAPFRETERREKESSCVILLDSDNPLTSRMLQFLEDKTATSKGFSELWKRDPEGLRRMNLELEWVVDDVSGKEYLIINDILAGHWRGLETEAGLSEAEEIDEGVTANE